jgi:hypothetical protein
LGWAGIRIGSKRAESLTTTARNNPRPVAQAGSADGYPLGPEQHGPPEEVMEGQPVTAMGVSGSKSGKRTLFDRLDAFVSKLSTRNNFWHRVCSMIWLPYAFHSGIKMKRLDAETFAAVLPFRRFNRNWYNAMAGAALLGNAEIAGGMYVFGKAGADYTVVCKKLEYRFLRPCFGPAVYKIKPKEDIVALIAEGTEFNCTLNMAVMQSIPGTKDKRVGKVIVTFHVTPKDHYKQRLADRNPEAEAKAKLPTSAQDDVGGDADE